MNRHMKRNLILYLAFLFLVCCKSIGPGRLAIDREDYNIVVRKSDQEEVLLNIIRGRYIETAQSIQISSLTASYNFNESIEGTVNATTMPGPVNLSSSLSPNISYSDNPTITYVPMSDSDFAKSILTPITMSNFILLTHSGSFDYINLMSIFFTRMNDLSSSIDNINGFNIETPEFKKFYRVLHLLNYLSRHNQLEKTRPINYGSSLGLMVSFKPNAEMSAHALHLKKLLNVAPKSKNIIFLEQPIVDNVRKINNMLILDIQKPTISNLVYVNLRSLLSAYHWLGFGVHMPPQEIAAHKTREIYKLDGRVYQWNDRIKNLFVVYYSDREPFDDVALKIKTHGHWFYIQASDSASKDTLNAMTRLFTLTSAVGNTPNTGPTLTVPVQKQPNQPA